MTLIFDLLTLKAVSKSRVTWVTSVPILVFLALVWSETVGLGLGLAVLVFCETRSCNARRHNYLEGHSNF